MKQHKYLGGNAEYKLFRYFGLDQTKMFWLQFLKICADINTFKRNCRDAIIKTNQNISLKKKGPEKQESCACFAIGITN